MKFATQGWTDAELNESILRLCDEFPDVRMLTCSRAVEFCRHQTPRGSPQTLLVAMRAELRRTVALRAA